MITMELFSRKHKLHRSSIDLIHENVPIGVRRALINLLSRSIRNDDFNSWMIIQSEIFKAPQITRDFVYQMQSPVAQINIRAILEQCQWYSFLDMCQLLAALFGKEDWRYDHPSLTGRAFSKTINEIFTDNSLGYEYRNGNFERIGAPYIYKIVTQARQILQYSGYSGPNKQFEKAIAFLNERPNPDTANCIKDSITAVEALARIVTGNEKLLLSNILNREPMRSGIHGALREMIQKLYAYRGDAEGAAHGQTSSDQIPVEEAELALGVSAACIVYLAKKFGKES
jgi:hypothetical protein